jgi:hypothetical protein
MQIALQWEPPLAHLLPPLMGALQPAARPPEGQASLPPLIEAAIWRWTEPGDTATSVRSSGRAALDAELRGGGWQLAAATEVLTTQPFVLEWRLLSPTVRARRRKWRPSRHCGCCHQLPVTSRDFH